MAEKKTLLPLSAVWNQLDRKSANEQLKNEGNDSVPLRNPVSSKHTSPKKDEIKYGFGQRSQPNIGIPAEHSARPKSGPSSHKHRNQFRSKSRNNIQTEQTQDYRSSNLKKHSNVNSVASGQCMDSRDNKKIETKQDSYQFCSNSRERVQKGKIQNSQSQLQGNRSFNSQTKYGNKERKDVYPDNPRDSRVMSFSFLKDLISKTPNEILLTINNKKYGFIILTRQDNVRMDLMALVLIALGKACTATLNQTVSNLLNTVCSNINSFLLSIQKYLVSLRQGMMRDFHSESLAYLIVFLQKFQHTLPSSSSEVISMLLPLLQIKCENFLKSQVLYNDIMIKLKEIDEENKTFIGEHTPQDIEKRSKREKMQLSEPPENYRSVPVLPTIDDIYSNAFLRPNIVKGKYVDAEQYLDIQYRLLREDYVKPLRDGIADYLSLKKAGKSVKHCRDVKVYENVRIVKQDFVNGGIVHIAQFISENFSRIKWEYSKRFLSGSLLCLSSDNFQTMLFASVAQRIPEQLKKGLLLIRFENISDEVLNITPLRTFVVIETTAYFEAYRHNLKALHELDETILPFKNYIIDVESTVECPKFLKDSTEYDFRPLLIPIKEEYIKRTVNLSGEVSIQYEYPTNVASICKSVQIKKDSCWPSASLLNLDNSQYLALKAAITKEFAIIQGPPGTGKTYVGLRIAQLLLHNIDKWFSKQTNSLPVLVVCYTNHALDQFLEGLMCFTDKIVRIGGRGSNEAVAKYQLSNLKRNAVTKKEIPKYISAGMWQKNHELKNLKIEIDQINRSILNSTRIVLGEMDLINVIPSFQYASLKSILNLPILAEYNLSDDGLLIHDWLGLRFRGGWSVSEDVYEMKDVIFQNTRKFVVPEPDDTDDVESIGEADVEFIEAQRDIDSEEFAGVSFEIEEPEKEEWILPEDTGWHVQGGRKQRLKYVKHCLDSSQPLEEKEALKIRNVWTLQMPEKWQLYKYWLHLLNEERQQTCFAKQLMLKQQYQEVCEMRTEGDIFVLQNAHVIGMTTTGAAKYRDIVLRLNPQILIVEEAAEILESHIVTSLAPKTQQVILIGDHQQLRPSPTVHWLAVNYDLNISLFERMIKNKMDCYRLSIQHRMRPEVADLIVPHIYKDLKNHESVLTYENIKGVSKNVFFITHNFNELSENDSKSKHNDHEAKFLIKLCKYLVLQGYDPSQITVLTTYTGQLYAMKKLMTDKIKKVRFTVVDNFQGEENDIILISFVRSNEEGQIGFLNIANRVCVALSRAKKGLFCIGNFELLAEKSDLWKNITSTMQQKQAIGPSLQLVCQNHPGVCNVVASEKDFDSVPEGGCTRVCEYRLGCGHACSLMCHPYDSAHEKVRCHKACNETCEFGHKCPKKCFEKCGDCVKLIDKKMSSCRHTIKIHCHMQNSKVKCTAKCEKLLLCGHGCSNTCSETCTLLCKEKIRIKSPICNHMITIECHLKNCAEELIKSCKTPCKEILSCSHICKGNCFRCHQGRLHVACNQPCKRVLVCGHECKASCAKSCPPCKVPCENRCIHSKCPKECGEPCKVCTEKCEWSCEHQHCSRSCGEMCDRIPCNKPCHKLLSCGHNCIGYCGEPCPEECRECDPEKVQEIFFGSEDEEDAKFVRLEDCGHILEINGINEWLKTDNKGDQQIQMKACPKCKTIIRTNLRFGNTVKDCLQKIENVKRLTFGIEKVNKDKQKKLFKLLIKEASTIKLLKRGSIYDSWCKTLSSNKCRSIQEITTLENIFRVSLKLAEIIQKLKTFFVCVDQDSTVKEGVEVLSIFMKASKNSLIDFIDDEFLTASEQQLQQLTWEIHRLVLGVNLLDLVEKIVPKSAVSDFEKCVSLLIRYSPFGDDAEKAFSTSFQKLAQACGSAVINISNLEKESILKAMNLSRGHWYQCPNGHVYCITECGGASQVSKCNECNAQIGGTNHSLLSTNRVATDMDGARHGAWSDAMNMENYEPVLNNNNNNDNDNCVVN